jgi:hypothetical protein
MNINNIILVLIIIALLLFLWIILSNNSNTLEQFTTYYDTEENIYGNIIAHENPNEISFNKIFKKMYIITAFYVECDNNYTIKVNNSYISYNDNINLSANKYYDISNLNVKSKEISFLSTSNISKVIIYGLNIYNTKTRDIYDNSLLLMENNVDNDNIILKNENDYLLDYLELPSTDNHFSIKYKNSLSAEFKSYSSDIIDLDNKYHKNSTKIYFDKPLLASTIKFIDYSDNLNNVKIYGKIATDNDIKSFYLSDKISEETDKQASYNKCPPMNEIINKQKLINDLCNSISEKDKIRAQQTYYEKTKKYLNKLKQQEAQIQSLKAQLDTLLKNSDKNSFTFQEKAASIKSMISDISTNPFNRIDINYDSIPTQLETTTTQVST